uniref:Uncharacterized protein n=1 Tax=Arundo donax TaxID=35708 RepID=A0A0A9B695_ARUDO
MRLIIMLTTVVPHPGTRSIKLDATSG